MKVPSAGDSPTSDISSAIPTTIISAAATNNSRRSALAMKRNTGPVRVRPTMTTAAIAATVASAVCQPFSPATRLRPASWASSAPWPPGMASSGSRASIGMTAMSCVSSTAKLACPPSDFSRPFSVRVCSTMAVDDSASTAPAASATVQGRPKATPAAITASIVSATCPPPSPSSRPRMSHSVSGSSSSPTRNSIITTPNSAKCWICTTSTFSTPSAGLIAMPAIR